MRCALDAAAVGEIVRDAGGAEGMAANRGLQPEIGGAATHHAPYIRARKRPSAQPLCFAKGGAKTAALCGRFRSWRSRFCPG